MSRSTEVNAVAAPGEAHSGVLIMKTVAMVLSDKGEVGRRKPALLVSPGSHY